MSKDAFQKILAADDGSPSGEHAALIAVKLAAKMKAEVILLGVVAPPNIQAAGEGLPLEDPSICRRAMEARFERFLNLGKSLGVDMMLEIVEGRPAEQIQKRAKMDQVDLIVVGQRHPPGTHKWFGASTSETVLRDSTCSVMVAR
jgi:nucleotide-binding universal stress UspA family protein